MGTDSRASSPRTANAYLRAGPVLETKKRRQRMVDGSISKDTGARTLEDSRGRTMDKRHVLSHSPSGETGCKRHKYEVGG